MRNLESKARKNKQRIVLAEAHDEKVLKAAQAVAERGLAHPILLGSEEIIKDVAEEFAIDISGCEILDARAPESKKYRKSWRCRQHYHHKFWVWWLGQPNL